MQDALAIPTYPVVIISEDISSYFNPEIQGKIHDIYSNLERTIDSQLAAKKSEEMKK